MKQLLEKNWHLSEVSLVLRMMPDHRPRVSHRDRRACGFALSIDQHTDYSFDDGTVLHHTPGTLIYLPRGSNYDVHPIPDKRGTLWCINFYMEPEEAFPPFICRVGDARHLERFFMEAEKAWGSQIPGYVYRARVLIDEICFAMAQSMHPIYRSVTHRKQVDEALSYIDGHLTHPDLKVSDIAAHLNLSDVFLRRLFHDQMGFSPLRIIKNKRMARAKGLLESTFLTISDISELSGFSCPSYFCSEFKRATGMTPMEYREHVAT